MRESASMCVCLYACVRTNVDEKRTEKREAAFKFVQPPLFRALLHDKTYTTERIHTYYTHRASNTNVTSGIEREREHASY